LVWDTAELSREIGAGLRPAGRVVREVAAPDDAIDAQPVAQLDAHPVLVEPPVGVLPEVLARPPRQPREAVEPLRPVAVLLVLDVHLLVHEGHPADSVLA